MAPFDPAWLKEQLEFFEVHAQQARASGLDGSIGAVIVATKGGDAKLEIKKKLSDVVLGPRLEEKPAEIDFRKVFDYKSKATLEIEVDASEFGLGFGTEKKEAATKRTVTAKVKVLRGIDLTKESWYSGSDPFVELTGATGSVAARTAVKKSAGGDSPVEWNEELSIKLEVTDDGVDVVPTHGLRAKLIDKCGFWRPDVLLAIGETSLAGLRAKEKAVLPIKLVNESVASFVKDQTDEGRANLANLRFLRKQLAEAGFAGHVQYTFGSVASSGSVEKGLGIVVDVPFEPAKPSEEEKIEGVHKDFAAWYEKKSADWRKVLFEAAYSLGFGAAHAPSGGAFELTEVVDAGHRVKVRVAVDLLAYVKTGQYQEEAKKRHEEEQRKAEEEEARKREELRKAQEEAARKEEEATKKQQEKEAEEAKKQQPPQKAAEQEASEAKKDADTTGEKAKEKDGVPKEGAKEEAKKEEAQAAAEAKPVEEKK